MGGRGTVARARASYTGELEQTVLAELIPKIRGNSYKIYQTK